MVPRDDWFDRLARKSAGGMSRRDAIGWFSASALMAFVGMRVKPRTAFAATLAPAADPGCAGTRTFYRKDCSNKVPKQNYKPAVNGCGPQNGFNPVPQTPLYMASFTPACDEHDRGYGTCNRPKEDTDAQFLADMYEICTQSYPVTGLYTLTAYIQCTRSAEIYYLAVSTIGDEPYADGQKEGCDCCDECPGGGPKCGGECCRRDFICGDKGKCCQKCQDGWIKCAYPNEPRCGFGCCMPGAPVCCPGMQPGSLRCCNGKCYKGGCG
ncbi:MAG: group secretory phospholipase [Gemmatimonadetes bacterium]|nr:group secretory phospholipase [Gemmatimonadota bacterium]